MMVDLREYSFGDWFRLLMKFVPAMLLAQLVWTVIFAGPVLIFWFFVSF